VGNMQIRLRMCKLVLPPEAGILDGRGDLPGLLLIASGALPSLNLRLGAGGLVEALIASGESEPVIAGPEPALLGKGGFAGPDLHGDAVGGVGAGIQAEVGSSELDGSADTLGKNPGGGQVALAGVEADGGALLGGSVKDAEALVQSIGGRDLSLSLVGTGAAAIIATVLTGNGGSDNHGGGDEADESGGELHYK